MSDGLMRGKWSHFSRKFKKNILKFKAILNENLKKDKLKKKLL